MAHVIEFKSLVSEAFLKLYNSRDDTDITFLVEEAQFPCHKLILAARNAKMGDLMEENNSKKNMRFFNTTAVAFDLVLRYLYGGSLDLKNCDVTELMNILKLVSQLEINELKAPLSDYAKSVIDISNVDIILDFASSRGYVDLQQSCHTYIDKNAPRILDSSLIHAWTWENLINTIKRVGSMSDYKKFAAMARWAEHHKITNRSDIFACVNFRKLSHIELTKVKKSRLLSAEEILDALTSNIPDGGDLVSDSENDTSVENISIMAQHGGSTCGACTGKSGSTSGESNISEVSHLARASKSLSRASLSSSRNDLGGDSGRLGGLRFYVDGQAIKSHRLSYTAIEKEIQIALPSELQINTIKFEITGDTAVSYKVEVSQDWNYWTTVIDYTSFRCSSEQLLIVPKLVCRHTKITFSNATANFYIKYISLTLEKDFPTVVGGVIIATRNKAVRQWGARVIDIAHDSEAETKLLLGKLWEYKVQESRFPFITRKLNEPLTIRLPMPYYVNTVSCVFPRQVKGFYRYFIQTSINGEDWEMLVDNRNKDSEGIMRHSFSKRIVNFVRITTTQGPDDQMRIVHVQIPDKSDRKF